MTLVGESGEITEVIEIGPAHLVRHRTWYGLGPLIDALTREGLDVTVLEPGSAPGPSNGPDVWILSDLPMLAASASGLLDALTATVPMTAGLVMVGGAFSYSGLNGLGGWQDPSVASLLPVVLKPFADATERPDGVRMLPSPECPDELRRLLLEAPPFFGYNLVEPREGSSVLARFGDGAPAIVAEPTGSHRSVALTTDLLPHWSPGAAEWDGLPAFLRILCGLCSPSGSR